MGKLLSGIPSRAKTPVKSPVDNELQNVRNSDISKLGHLQNRKSLYQNGKFIAFKRKAAVELAVMDGHIYAELALELGVSAKEYLLHKYSSDSRLLPITMRLIKSNLKEQMELEKERKKILLQKIKKKKEIDGKVAILRKEIEKIEGIKKKKLSDTMYNPFEEWEVW